MFGKTKNEPDIVSGFRLRAYQLAKNFESNHDVWRIRENNWLNKWKPQHQFSDKYIKLERWHEYSDGSTVISFRFPSTRSSSKRKGLIEFRNIRPSGDLRELKIKETPFATERIDGASILFTNRTKNPLTVEYDAGLEGVETEASSFRKAFRQDIKTSVEGEYSGVKVGLEVSLGFEQETTDEHSKSTSLSQGYGIEYVVPPQTDIRISAERSLSKINKQITGFGEFSYTFTMGKHWSSKWRGEVQYNSIDEVIRVLSGKAPNNLKHAAHYRRRPNKKELVDLLRQPMNLPFELSYDYGKVLDSSVTPIQVYPSVVNLDKIKV